MAQVPSSNAYTRLDIPDSDLQRGDASRLNRSLNLLAKRIQAGESSSAPAASSTTTNVTNTSIMESFDAVSVTTSPYQITKTNLVVVFNSGAATASLPSATSVLRNPIILINNSGSTVTLYPFTGDTINGLSSYDLTDGSDYQILPNC